jgi:hypothetical protein
MSDTYPLQGSGDFGKTETLNHAFTIIDSAVSATALKAGIAHQKDAGEYGFDTILDDFENAGYGNILYGIFRISR